MLEKLEQGIASQSEGRFALLNRSSYKVYELKRESWNKLAAADDDTTTTTAAFVDGGQCEVVKTPSAELHWVRTAVVFVEGRKLASVRRKEGYLLATAVVEKDEAKYCVEFFESSLDHDEKLEFKKAELVSENEASALGKAAETARRLSELGAARWAVKELGKRNGQKLVVLDGTLETFTGLERKELELLMGEAKENDVLILSVAKTCTILTDSGESLIAAADRIGNGQGYVVAAAGAKEKHNAVVAIARLDDASSYLFRVEAATEGELKNALSSLTLQSNDLAFPGYPYGLMMADRFARISNADLELTRSRIMATAGTKLKAVMKQARALDAHGILDRM